MPPSTFTSSVFTSRQDFFLSFFLSLYFFQTSIAQTILIYAWIGCNSAKFGHLYAAAPTRPSNAVSVTSLIGGSSDNAGAGIARRIVLKTGLNVVLACNLPKNSPLLEAAAERRLVQKLVSLGYATPKSGVSSSTQEG
ncbi:unnamed protein product [Coffea canephora]|uniref:Uncharacterized protein n=1 Tax=Coffea canephora TaxID=49390 RepID=A0A068TQZ4_COFCA|nr:unnamed protein product [Coffea canephora]